MKYKHSKQGQIAYPSNTLECAKIIGKGRWVANQSIRSQNSDYQIGDEQENRKCDIRGVFAELIAGHYFWTHQIKYQSAPLLSEDTQTVPDITLLDNKDVPYCNIDVKSVKKKGIHFNVNCANFRKNQLVDTYFFVQASADYDNSKCIANYYVVGETEIQKWKVEKAGTGRAYFSKSISDHLSSLGIESI